MFGDPVGVALFSGLVGAYFLGTLAFAAFVMNRLGELDSLVDRLEARFQHVAAFEELLRQKGDKGSEAMPDMGHDAGGDVFGAHR